MSLDAKDDWALGIVSGLVRVTGPTGRRRRESWPEELYPFVEQALWWVKRRKLEVDPRVIQATERWLKKVAPPKRRKKLVTKVTAIRGRNKMQALS